MVGSSKHQRKVDECYPRGSGEVGPVGGKISALTYYINAKPEKLLKVSAYLERKVPRDLIKESSQYNGVTLDIVNGIMKACEDYFVSFAPTVLKILHWYSEAMVSAKIVQRIHELFSHFCRMAKSILPSIRSGEFFNLLTMTERRLLTAPISGLWLAEDVAKDIQAAISMEDFRGPGGDERMAIVINAIVKEFRAHEGTQLTSLEMNLIEGSNSITKQTKPYGALHIAGSAFLSLIEGCNSSSISLIMGFLFREFDADGWAHNRLCHVMLNTVIHRLPAQYLCVFLSEIFRKLETSDGISTAILADSIGELLKSNRSPLGYTALEFTGNLLKLLRKQRSNLLDAPRDTRSSFAKYTVPPPRTVFAICNAFVSLLRNANFALQKYEIIEHLLSKSFIPPSMYADWSEKHLPLQLPTELDRHSLGTVTLDSTEENHFKSIVWGILFALAEEGTPPSVLRFAFVDINVKLFELLFKMVGFDYDDNFSLNTIMLWRELLSHGLSIVPNRPRQDGSAGALPSAAGIVLGRPSIYILAKTRVSLANIFKLRDHSYPISIIHVTAIMALVNVIVLECDVRNLIMFSSFVLWMHGTALRFDFFTFEDRACVTLFSNYILQSIGAQIEQKGRHGSLFELTGEYIARMNKAGMSLISMEDTYNMSLSGPIITAPTDCDELLEMIPKPGEIKRAFLQDAHDAHLSSEVEAIAALLDQEYTLESDNALISAYSQNPDRPVASSFLHHPLMNAPNAKRASSGKSVIGTFSRFSQLGVDASTQSAITAPAFYAASAGFNPTAARALTVSSTSLNHSDIQSLASSIQNTDVLDSQFNVLSSRARDQSRKEKTKSALLFSMAKPSGAGSGDKKG